MTSNFGDFGKKMRDLAQRASSLGGEHHVPLTELFPPAFMRRHSRFDSFEALVEAGPWGAKTAEDFKAIPDAEWDAHVQENTSFAGWQSMQQAGVAAWGKGKLGL